jgi:hypothetical protein
MRFGVWKKWQDNNKMVRWWKYVFILILCKKNVKNNDDYVIYILRNIRYIFDNKNNKAY